MLDKYYHGTAEQLNEVLINGSATFTDKDGNQQTITREQIENGTVVIDTGSADIATFLNAVRTDMHRLYGYNHDAIVTDDLETIYDSIISENPELAELSAVGFTALLRNGDVIPAQNNIMFINGTQEETDYAFSGENSEGGTEFVSVWYFENDGVLTADRVNANVVEISVKVKQTTPDFSSDFFDYADCVTSNINLPYTPLGTRKQKNLMGGNISDVAISAIISEYENHCTEFSSFEGLKAKTTLKKVSFPNLTTVAASPAGSYSFLCGCSGCKEINIPQLISIGGATSRTTASFRSVPNITLPETVKTVGDYVFDNNRSIKLLCKNATSISANWCSSTPSETFTICTDWGASINLAVAAANWSEDQWYQFLIHQLRRYPAISPDPEVVNPENLPHLLKVSQAVINYAATHGVTGVEPEYEGDLISEYLPKIGWRLTP